MVVIHAISCELKSVRLGKIFKGDLIKFCETLIKVAFKLPKGIQSLY